jgi:hypothetical protein
MEVDGHFHVPGKDNPVFTEYVAGWVPQLLLDAMAKTKLSFLFLPGWNIDSSVFSL